MKKSEQRKKEDRELIRDCFWKFKVRGLNAEQAIEQLNLEPKPRLELNRWIVKDRSDNWIIFLDGENDFYGAFDDSEWFRSDDTILKSNNIYYIQDYNNDSSYRYATDEEILDRLSKVAIKMGYKERQSDCLSIYRNRKIDLSTCTFNLNKSKALVVRDAHYANVIFKDGKWADFIETDSEKIERLEKEVKELKNKIK